MSLSIVYVSTIFPYPAHRGGKLRISNIIRRLSERHSVHLVSLCAEHKGRLPELRERAEETVETVQPVPHDRRRWKGGLRSLLFREPYEVGLHQNPEMERVVERIVERVKPDLLWCSRLASLQFVPEGNEVPVLLDQHDLASRLWKIMADRASKWWVKAFSHYNRRLVERYEDEIYQEIDICVSVSDQEKELTAGIAQGTTPCIVAPNGVDISYFSPSGEHREEPGMLVSIGSMDQVRNVDASRFFVQDILPQLRNRGLDVTYYIVGQNPTPEVRSLGRKDGVEVTGTVEDVRPFLERSSVVVAPYRLGSGVKHKIPIAFAMGKPVVATPNACQGLDVTHGENVMIAEDPDSFADAIDRLLGSSSERKEMGKRAQEFIREEYSWDVIVARLIDEVEEAVGREAYHSRAPIG